MKMKLILSCLSLTVALSLGACAHSPEEKKVERSRSVTITATVQAIDQATRIVTLKGPAGNMVTFTVDKAVKNLPQVKVGDEVVVTYYESLVLRVLKPEEAPVNTAAVGLATAKPGQMPAGVAGGEATVTVTIEGIDTAAGTVTFKTPAGSSNTVRAADPKNLEKIKVGDRVAITYTEAVAVSVEKAGK